MSLQVLRDGSWSTNNGLENNRTGKPITGTPTNNRNTHQEHPTTTRTLTNKDLEHPPTTRTPNNQNIQPQSTRHESGRLIARRISYFPYLLDKNAWRKEHKGRGFVLAHDFRRFWLIMVGQGWQQTWHNDCWCWARSIWPNSAGKPRSREWVRNSDSPLSTQWLASVS